MQLTGLLLRTLKLFVLPFAALPCLCIALFKHHKCSCCGYKWIIFNSVNFTASPRASWHNPLFVPRFLTVHKLDISHFWQHSASYSQMLGWA
jgi:hypothetical protein